MFPSAFTLHFTSPSGPRRSAFQVRRVFWVVVFFFCLVFNFLCLIDWFLFEAFLYIQKNQLGAMSAAATLHHTDLRDHVDV